MPEIHPDNLREMHTQLTAAGIVEHAGIAFDTIRLEARVDVARDTILTLTRERDAARSALTEAGTVNSRLAADLSRTQTERETLRQQLANTMAANNAVVEVLLLAGFRERDTTIADDVRALAAERDAARTEAEALRARLAERPTPPDHRDPPVETAAEATVRRLRAYLSEREGFDYTGERYNDMDVAEVVIRNFRDSNKTVRNLEDQLERAERIAVKQFRHRIRGT